MNDQFLQQHLTDFQRKWLKTHAKRRGLQGLDFLFLLLDAAAVAGFAWAIWLDGPLQLAILYVAWVLGLKSAALIVLGMSFVSLIIDADLASAGQYARIKRMATVLHGKTTALTCLTWIMCAAFVGKIGMICAAGPWWMIFAAVYLLAAIAVGAARYLLKSAALVAVQQITEQKVLTYEVRLAMNVGESS